MSNNHIEHQSHKYPDQKVSFLGLPLYSRKYEKKKREQHPTIKYQLLGVLVQFKKRYGGCRLSVLGITVLTHNRLKTKILGINVRKHDFTKKWLDKIQPCIDKEYDDIYILRHNIGESYVELMHLGDAIRANESKRPLLILWNKKYAGFYKMFLPQGMDMRFVKLYQDDVHMAFAHETHVLHNGQRFICMLPDVAENMKELMVEDPKINFYDHINKAAGVKKGAIPALPQPSVEAIRSVQSKINRIGLSSKFVILCPEAISLVELKSDFWEALAEGLRKKGYDIFVNAHDEDPLLGNGKTAKMTIEEIFILAKQSAGIISLGSGLAVFLTAAGVKMDLLYTDFRQKRIGYDSKLALRIYSVHHLPGISQELVKEYDMSKLNEQDLIETILERY